MRVLVRDGAPGGICGPGSPGAVPGGVLVRRGLSALILTTRHNGDVTTATLTERPPSAVPAVGRPNPTQIGTIVWLASEVMFFGGLFAMWFTLRSEEHTS